MDSLAIVITVVTLLGATLGATHQWKLREGVILYWLMASVSMSHLTVECLVAYRDPELMSQLLYTPLEVWTLIMAYKGWQREKSS